MKSQPLVLQSVPGVGSILVLESLWRFFSNRAQAESILPIVKAVVPDAEIVDLANQFGQSFTYLDQVTRLWGFKGTFALGERSLSILEYAGWLYDRQTEPQPFVDVNPDTTLGGPYLAVSDVGNDCGQMHWQKAKP